jgi:hypothetical protein
MLAMGVPEGYGRFFRQKSPKIPQLAHCFEITSTMSSKSCKVHAAFGVRGPTNLSRLELHRNCIDKSTVSVISFKERPGPAARFKDDYLFQQHLSLLRVYGPGLREEGQDGEGCCL